jgi:hypothetical protein
MLDTRPIWVLGPIVDGWLLGLLQAEASRSMMQDKATRGFRSFLLVCVLVLSWALKQSIHSRNLDMRNALSIRQYNKV